MQTLTDALAAALGGAAECDRALLRLERNGDGWRLHFATGESLDADEVVLAVPAAVAALLLAPLDDDLAATLREIPSGSIAVVALAFDAAAIGGAPDGFGFLVPRGEGPRILGCLWDSSIFPGQRAPTGKVLVRAMVGGALDADAVGLPDAELLRLVRADLARAMGLVAEPEHQWIFRHALGISQYTVGHRVRLAGAAERLRALPGLHLAGQSYFGVSVNSCCERAARFAEEWVAQFQTAAT